MKIVKMITSQNVETGERHGMTHFVPGAPSMPAGLKITAGEIGHLGPSIILSTDALAAKKQVSVIYPSNIVNLVIENDEDLAVKKAK